METKVLTNEEIETLKEVSNLQNNLIISLGQIEYQIFLLEFQKNNLKTEIQNIEKRNIDLGKTLTDKYGSGNINLETGEIIID